MRPLKIGLITDSLIQSQALKDIVESCGHTAAVTLSLDDNLATEIQALPCSIEAWLVKFDAECDHGYQRLSEWLEQTSEPVIFIDDYPESGSQLYRGWARRIRNKIQHLSGSINLAKASCVEAMAEQIESVWVLAASTGGPEAVKAFMSSLPADVGIAFIYVQHIDSQFENTLAQVMRRDSHYPVYLAEHGELLRSDAIAVISSDYWTELHPNGTFINKQEPWSGYFSPSADQVAANVARAFGKRANMIVFSGMENDGAAACRLIRQQGGQVWVQSPASCVSPSMPEMAVATGCVDYSGSVEGLARRLAQAYASKKYNR